ncbi:prepilin-type N-terminal cleavage/methylation domain-containing protein [Candidatus Poribacteria bacterium]|nr:prepilin-type N-terminal cleavage/methylation domain-containing protein [Candidatus Poribacteria bacterium]
MIKYNRNENKGFSLIELMIVVTIVGILMAIGSPIYKRIQNRAKTAEVSGNMHAIRTLELAYKGTNDQFITLPPHPADVPSTAQVWGNPGGNWESLGFGANVDGAQVRYQYQVNGNPDIKTAFIITAMSDFKDDGAPFDTWTLDNNGNITHTNEYE